MSKGKLFVISGASGVGKSTVLSRVMAARDDLKFSVSATTRPPRPGEQEAVSYYFVSHEKFREMIDADAFLEYDDHMGNFYGTPKTEVEKKLAQGHVILDIEPVGAFNVRRQRPDAVLIFIAPPSMEVLLQRLQGRGDTSPEQIRVRQERVAWEMEQSKRYDHLVINDELDVCVRQVLQIIADSAD